MSNIENHKRLIAQIYKEVRDLTWPCILENCSCDAINSHLLQRNGILNNVSVDGHLIEVKMKDPFKWTEFDTPIEMKRIGINKAFSLSLFCNQHDSLIFKPIETHPLDFESYEIQLLFCYRVICAEIRKKEMGMETHRRLIKAFSQLGNKDTKLSETFIKGATMGVKDLSYYKLLFENELMNKKGKFVFKTFKYPLIKIYGSATFSLVDDQTVDPEQEQPLDSVFLHIIPYNNELNLIIGYHSDFVNEELVEFIESWSNLEAEQFEVQLTNLFATRIENWGISPKIYDNLNKETLDTFLRSFQLTFFTQFDININLFENKNYGT